MLLFHVNSQWKTSFSGHQALKGWGWKKYINKKNWNFNENFSNATNPVDLISPSKTNIVQI